MKPIRARVAGGQRQQVPHRTTIDGRSYPVPLDEKIDRVVFLALGNENGKLLLDYLEGITLRTVLPVEATDEALRDLEGQRRLVAMLKHRLRRASEHG